MQIKQLSEALKLQRASESLTNQLHELTGPAKDRESLYLYDSTLKVFDEEDMAALIALLTRINQKIEDKLRNFGFE